MIVAGINGFGRFGLHLLKYWLDRSDRASFQITCINDDTLSLEDAYRIIVSDPYVVFDEHDVRLAEDSLVVSKPSGQRHVITYTNAPSSRIAWLGKPHVLFECSGKETVAQMRQSYLCGRTKLVIISATSWDADDTLIYGFNHHMFSPNSSIISYGSCTVNAYVPLAELLHRKFTIVDSDVHVIHNTAAYKLDGDPTLHRRACTLQKAAGRFLPFLNERNFLVKYTVIPYSGVSMIDFRFRLKSQVSRDVVLAELENGIAGRKLSGLYGFHERDSGPERFTCSPYSAVFIKNAVNVLGDNLYLQAYFDTENSANRFFDLADYLSAYSGLAQSPPGSVNRDFENRTHLDDEMSASGRVA